VNYSIEKVALRPRGKKRWEFEGRGAKTVEAAVLDFYRAGGWDGFFTERDNFFAVVFMMMCWLPDKEMRSKSGPRGFVGGCSDVFSYAKDGDIPNFDYSLSDVYSNALSFKIEHIDEVLDNWLRTRRRWLFFDERQLKDEAAVGLYLSRLESFFRANGGVDFFYRRLLDRYPRESFSLAREVRDHERQHRGAFRGVYVQHQLVHLEARNYIMIPSRRYSKGKLFEEWVAEVEKLPDSEALSSFSGILERIKYFRSAKDRWWKGAVLDLEIWNSNEAFSVEVKAPGDRLNAWQEYQLRRDNLEGRASKLILVETLE
jgi:hypothetical protein